MKVSMFGIAPTVFRGPDGSLTGTDTDTIELLKELLNFKPVYTFARSYDESIILVNNGSAELGMDTAMSYDRNQLIDFPSFLNFNEAVYAMRVSQPLDILYQVSFIVQLS